MPRVVRIALCQLASVSGDVAANLARIATFAKEASSQRADLIVFPEFVLTSLAVAEQPELADEAGKAELVQIARKCNIDIVGGWIERAPAHDEASTAAPLLNVAYYIDRTGKTLCRYVKKNLWHPERDYLTAGTDERLTFATAKFTAGLLVCWDLAWPEAARTLMGAGAEVILVPTCWLADDVGQAGLKHDPEALGEMSWLDSLVITRAYENECCVVFVNAGGARRDGFLGRSAVAMPFKGCIRRFEAPEERMEVVELDLDILKEARANYKIHDDVRAWASRTR